jgi:crotonobetainyl-CoA:carnitine CoA-transferase CaiB-like acyl-CoA transferase
MDEGALSHFKVVDLTHYVAGPFCTKLMAGFGADVIKVEKPATGDGMRKIGPFYKGVAGLEHSIPFLWLNTGKKSIVLNLKSAKGREILLQLIRDADVLIENFGPDTMDRFGLGFDALHRVNQRLVVTSITNFDEKGPYKNFKAEEIVEYAMSGLMQLTGRPDRSPLCSGPKVTQYSAGIQAYCATAIALWQREISGFGRHVTISIRESGLDNIEIALTEFLHTGKIANRNGDEHPLVPWKLYPCKDGYAAIVGGPARHWPAAAPMFEDSFLLQPHLQHMSGRIKYRAEVSTAMQSWLSKHGKKEICKAGQQRGLAFAYLATAEEVLNSPQHQARGFFQNVGHPITGAHPYCNAPFCSSVNKWFMSRAPLLGEHTNEIMTSGLRYSLDDVARLRAQEVI